MILIIQINVTSRVFVSFQVREQREQTFGLYRRSIIAVPHFSALELWLSGGRWQHRFCFGGNSNATLSPLVAAVARDAARRVAVHVFTAYRDDRCPRDSKSVVGVRCRLVTAHRARDQPPRFEGRVLFTPPVNFLRIIRTRSRLCSRLRHPCVCMCARKVRESCLLKTRVYGTTGSTIHAFVNIVLDNT